MTQNEIIDRARAPGLFTEEGCEVLVSFMDYDRDQAIGEHHKQRQEDHNERLQAIRKLCEIGD